MMLIPVERSTTLASFPLRGVSSLTLAAPLPWTHDLGPPRARHRDLVRRDGRRPRADRKSTRLNSSHVRISYAVFCLKKKSNRDDRQGLRSDQQRGERAAQTRGS